MPWTSWTFWYRLTAEKSQLRMILCMVVWKTKLFRTEGYWCSLLAVSPDSCADFSWGMGYAWRAWMGTTQKWSLSTEPGPQREATAFLYQLIMSLPTNFTLFISWDHLGSNIVTTVAKYLNISEYSQNTAVLVWIFLKMPLPGGRLI